MLAQDTATGAGVMLTDPGSGAVLFLKRGDDGDHPGEWCFPGGTIEDGETEEQAARREMREETGNLAAESFQVVDRGDRFTTFGHFMPKFTPALNNEHTDYAWTRPTEAPEPLHPGVRMTLNKLRGEPLKTFDSALAFDRKSVRTYDADGRLRVALNPISKANICEYLGREIMEGAMNGNELNLEPTRRYRLLRHPDELAKAAETFNNIPILDEHVPTNAENHPRERTVGATGSDAVFEAPYLKNTLVFWDAEAIRAVEDEELEQLSSGYRYTADMTPGVYLGEHHDGVMRDIVGNHVAQVREGRAGADVIVGDAAIPKPLKELTDMTHKPLSRKATLALGALLTALRPKLAQDAKIDLEKPLAGVTAANFASKKKAIVADVKKAITGKLATDAELGQVVENVCELIDSLESINAPDVADEALPVRDAKDAEPWSKAKEMLNGKVSAEDMAAIDAIMCPAARDEESEEDKKKREDKEKKEAEDKAAADRKATDEAIKTAVTDAEKRWQKTQTEIREAENAVRPYVGDLKIACDSAAAVYRTALGAIEADVDDLDTLPLPALKSVFKAHVEANAAAERQPKPRIAADAKATKSFFERYPGAERIKRAS